MVISGEISGGVCAGARMANKTPLPGSPEREYGRGSGCGGSGSAAELLALAFKAGACVCPASSIQQPASPSDFQKASTVRLLTATVLPSAGVNSVPRPAW